MSHKPQAIRENIVLKDGREITIETGLLAKQADGAVVVKVGGTMLLATVVAAKDAKGDETQTSNTPKNESLPTFTLNLTDLYSLEITEANRNSYTAVIVEWQDIEAGKTKSIKVGSGEQTYKMQIAQPKSDNEAFRQGEAKLNELQRGGINGRCSLPGANIVAGGKLKFSGIAGLEANEFSIKSVSHRLSTDNYEIEIEFEG